jgi:hypothetical protein
MDAAAAAPTCAAGSTLVWSAQGNLDCQKALPVYPLMASAAAKQTSAPYMSVETPLRSAFAPVPASARAPAPQR